MKLFEMGTSVKKKKKKETKTQMTDLKFRSAPFLYFKAKSLGGKKHFTIHDYNTYLLILTEK